MTTGATLVRYEQPSEGSASPPCLISIGNKRELKRDWAIFSKLPVPLNANLMASPSFIHNTKNKGVNLFLDSDRHFLCPCISQKKLVDLEQLLFFIKTPCKLTRLGSIKS